MNFEDCKKVFILRIEGKITKEELEIWGKEHCQECEYCAAYCNECPLYINEECRFGR